MKRTIFDITDDLDGSPADETIRFSVNGVDYVIDLNDRNALIFHKVLGRYIQAARREKQRRPRGAVAQRKDIFVNPKEARAWAIRNGLDVPRRGRLADAVLDLYRSDVLGDTTTASPRR